MIALDCFFHAKTQLSYKVGPDVGGKAPIILKVACPQIKWQGEWEWTEDGQ